MHLTTDHVYRIMAWDNRDGACVVRVTSVNRTGYNLSITYESSDGHREIIFESAYSSLDDLTKDWREATEEEEAAFLARFTPAPQNWY